MEIQISDLRDILVKISGKYMQSEESMYYADEIIDSYSRKYPRTNVLEKEVLEDTKRQSKYNDNKIIIKNNLPSLISVDFNNLPISYSLKWIHDTLYEKASNNGISIFGFTNSGGMHTLTTYVHGLATRGLFAIAGFNAGPNAVVPFNGTKGLLGNNPIAYSFPTDEGIQVVDMATSELPLFDLLNAKKQNLKLKDNCAVDSDGDITTDPIKVIVSDDTFNLLPIGGTYKGYAINYLVEIMTGALVSSRLSNSMDPSYINEEHGGFIICIDISKFSDLKQFKSEVSEFNNVIRKQRAKEEHEVTVPGDRSFEKSFLLLKGDKVNVDEGVWKKLNELTQI
jgi:LDH2 family malate/lactate/ureidoglycolate dehydrogenase